MNLDDLRVDPAKLAGVWWDFHTRAPVAGNKPHPTHFCLRIVPMGPAFHAARAEAIDAVAAPGRKLAPDTLQRAIGEAHGRATLIDWRNLEMGRPPVAVPFSVEKAVELLTDPQWIVLRQFVEDATASQSALLAGAEEAASGN